MDPRIEQIERSQVYGLFDRGVLIYIGATRLPLRTRIRAHRAEVGADPPIYQYLDRHVDDLHKDLEIRSLDKYESEKEALDDFNSTLNVDGPSGPKELKHSWTSQEVDCLEEMIEKFSLNQIGEGLGIHPRQVRNAAVKLDLIEITSDSIDWKKWDHKLGTVCDRELAELIGCSTRAVNLRRLELGIDAHGRINWEKWDQLLGEMPDSKLADRIGCSTPGVTYRRKKLGIEAYRPELSEKEILEIRVRYVENEDDTYPSLGKEYNRHRQTIGQIVRGDTHKHLPMPEDLTEEEKEDILEQSHN